MKRSLKLTLSPTLWISLVLACSVVGFRFVYPPINILSWDVFGYYLYLPATFIYHDPGLSNISWVNQLIEQYQTTSTFYQASPMVQGGWVMKYSMGMALLNAPAFFAAQLYCLVAGYKADGFTLPYQYSWAISGLIYSIVGIFLMRKILLEFFDERLTGFLLIIIVLATNYFQLTAFDGYLSHNYLFTLYTFIVWFTLKWHRNPEWKTAFWLGLAMGLAVLVRPSELVCVLIPLLWGIGDRESFKLKLKLVRLNYQHILILAIAAFVAGFPQLAYWKYATGKWLFYSYNNAGEGFEFTRPYLKEVLFSFRKGWLVYTPVMGLAIAGFISLFRTNKSLFYCILAYFLINLYIVSSWTCWWYAGGSYSQRALLSSYVLLSFPLGYLLQSARSWTKVLRMLFYTILTFFLLLNIFQTWQWAHGIIDRTRMTKAYYMAIFGKTRIDESDRKLLLVERPADAIEVLKNENDYTRRTAVMFDFEQSPNAELTLSSDTVFEGRASLRLDVQHPFSQALELAYSEITDKDHAWIRAEVMVYPTDSITENTASLVITFQHKGESYNYRAKSIALKEFGMKPGKWNAMRVDYLTPEVRSDDDVIKVYFWLQGQKPVLIDNLKVDIFELK